MINLLDNEFVERKKWIDEDEFMNLVTIAESTPGPLAINCATFIGCRIGKIPGAIAATFGVILPSFIIILIIARSYTRFQDNRLVKAGLYGIKAAVVGLIGTAAFSVLSVTILSLDKFKEAPSIYTLFDIKQLIIFSVIFALYKIFKKHPIWYILFGAICGIVFL